MSTKQQMSQRMMKNTEDGRPFAQEFQDLFAALVTTLDLKSHRVRLQKRNHTFITKDAVEKLSALKLTSTSRRPDPKDPSRVYTTTTTTTFAMNKDCARSNCQKFLEARYVESLEGKTDFMHDGDVWQLTPKGVSILKTFALRFGINDRHVSDLCQSSKGGMNLVILEREAATDRVIDDRAMVDVVFRRFAGSDTTNFPGSGNHSDTDSLNETPSGAAGVKMTRERKSPVGNITYTSTFTGKAAMDWLMDCCTTVDSKEAFEIAQLFLSYNLIEPLGTERPPNPKFMSSKSTIYMITQEGKRVAECGRGKDAGEPAVYQAGLKTSNATRLSRIIKTPALRSLFREFLRETHCEENMTFYLEVESLLDVWATEQKRGPPRAIIVRELITVAYGIYNTFLAPSSSCEINIDHTLRNNIATRMSDIVNKDDERIGEFFRDVETLFRKAQSSIFKLIATDSVPKFMKDDKFAPQLRERNLAQALGVDTPPAITSPARSGSTSSDSGPRSGSFSSTDSTEKPLVPEGSAVTMLTT